MGTKIPGAVLEQADRLSALLLSVAVFFKDPAQAPRVGHARGVPDLKNADWHALSRRLADCADAAARAAEEYRRFEVPMNPRMEVASLELAAAGKALAQALRRSDEKSLLFAKNRAQEAGALSRAGARDALERPEIPLELKLKAVYGDFAAAAESLQQAADLAAELLFA